MGSTTLTAAVVAFVAAAGSVIGGDDDDDDDDDVAVLAFDAIDVDIEEHSVRKARVAQKRNWTVRRHDVILVDDMLIAPQYKRCFGDISCHIISNQALQSGTYPGSYDRRLEKSEINLRTTL